MNIKGFTIVELIIVMTVMVILSVVVVPRFLGSWAGIKASNAAMKIVSDIRYTQNRATTTQQRGQFIVDSTTAYRIRYCTSANFNSTTCVCTGGWTTDKSINLSTDFLGVTVTSSINPLEYDSLGRPYPTATCALAGNTTVTVSYSGSSKTITVQQQTGMVSVN